MAYALVGSAGAVSTGATGAAVTPAFGQTPTANNLLILFIASDGATTLPTTPTGWTNVRQKAGTAGCACEIAFKIAAGVASGGDSAPTVTGIASSVLSCQLAEFSGGAIGNPTDQTGQNTGTTSPLTATNGGASRAIGELILVCSALDYSASATKTITLSSNHVTSFNALGNSSALTTAAHYAFGWGASNSVTGADTGVLTFTTTSITGTALISASMLLAQSLPGGMLDVML